MRTDPNMTMGYPIAREPRGVARSSKHKAEAAQDSAEFRTNGVTAFRVSGASIDIDFRETHMRIRIARRVTEVWVDGERYVPRSSRIVGTIVAPEKYHDDILGEVNRLVATGYKTAEAFRKVTENTDIDPHNLRTAYYARGWHRRKVVLTKESGVPDSPSGDRNGLSCPRSRQ